VTAIDAIIDEIGEYHFCLGYGQSMQIDFRLNAEISPSQFSKCSATDGRAGEGKTLAALEFS
jgi:hypothetical protein